MVRLREIPRTATFAWSPGSGKPLLVTGTRAGAVDADFSDESKLELWDLSLDDPQQGIELQPVAGVGTDSRFYDVAWGPPDAYHPKGVIAGALENGCLGLWDAARLESRAPNALISQTKRHSGAIKTLQFNPLKTHVLATGGARGELFVYDVNDVANPFRLGNVAARSDDIDCLAWNRKVSHILATGGPGGFVTVWDLKTKKASLTVNNNRKPVSAIAWDPDNSTKLLTATSDDGMPVILLWDLRNSNAPEKTLQGHEQGVLSLSWCPQDSDLLLSSGKDNRTLVWNPQTGQRYGELPEMTNWTFQTRFNPHNPNLSATASFDGKVTIQTLQNSNPETSQGREEKNLDGEEFFRAAQTQPQGASWSLSKAPKWFERPVGASFGFGGKIVVFRASPAQPGQKRSSKVTISKFSADSDVSTATEQFQAALKSGNFELICEERMQTAKSAEERADWEVIKALIGNNPRDKIVSFLGFRNEALVALDNGAPADVLEGLQEPYSKQDNWSGGKKKAISDLFDGGNDEGEVDDFLFDSSAPKDVNTQADGAFHLFNDNDSSLEKDITEALMLGNFARATEICLREDRIADAFLIANCGGQELVDKVQSAYLSRKSFMPSYMRLLNAVIKKDLWDVARHADLKHWRETMAILCTFSDPNEFPDLCEVLGDRISMRGRTKDASFCYLVGSKLEKLVSIWAAELENAERAMLREPSEASTFSVHARYLQQFIEKVTVFRHVIKFQDHEQGQSAGWKLATLYDKYSEYADILAENGQLEVAQSYLDLLPANYPAAETVRSRVKLAKQKPATVRQSASSNFSSTRMPSISYQTPQTVPTVGAVNPYGHLGQSQTPAPLPPSYAAPLNPYQPSIQPGLVTATTPAPPRNPTPAGSTAPPSSKLDNWNDVPIVPKTVPRKPATIVGPPASPFPGQRGSVGPPPSTPYGQRTEPGLPAPPPRGPAPPRAQSPAVAPPQSFPAPASFSAQPPFPGQPSFPAQPSIPAQPPFPAQQAPPPRPPSTAASQYAPPAPQPGPAAPPVPQIPQMVPRTISPYKAPPSGPPPSNRYSPAPPAQQPPSQPPISTMPPPPAPGNRPSAASPYGSLPPQTVPRTQYTPAPAPPKQPMVPPPGPAPAGPPPPMGIPATAPATGSMGAPTPTPPTPKATTPAPKSKYPPGDRSHIPENAKRLVEIFSQDMQRVASKAPTTFAPQVKDTQKRLNLLFDHLNNEELVRPATVGQLSQLAEAMQAKDYATAQRIQADIQREKMDECGNWMVGVKRLISMSKATP